MFCPTTTNSFFCQIKKSYFSLRTANTSFLQNCKITFSRQIIFSIESRNPIFHQNKNYIFRKINFFTKSVKLYFPQKPQKQMFSQTAKSHILPKVQKFIFR